MDINQIIKESLLNEVGEATKTPFRYKRDPGYDSPSELKKEKDDFTYSFKTKEGYSYDVSITRQFGRNNAWSSWDTELKYMYTYDRRIYSNLRKLGAKRDDLANIWDVSFQITDGPKTIVTGLTWNRNHGYVTNDDKDNQSYEMGPQPYDEPNKGDFYRIMSTIIKIIKNHIKKYGGKIIVFEPRDDRRERIFSYFIKKQLPGTKEWANLGTLGGDSFYFLLNI